MEQWCRCCCLGRTRCQLAVFFKAKRFIHCSEIMFTRTAGSYGFPNQTCLPTPKLTACFVRNEPRNWSFFAQKLDYTCRNDSFDPLLLWWWHHKLPLILAQYHQPPLGNQKQPLFLKEKDHQPVQGPRGKASASRLHGSPMLSTTIAEADILLAPIYI